MEITLSLSILYVQFYILMEQLALVPQTKLENGLLVQVRHMILRMMYLE